MRDHKAKENRQQDLDRLLQAAQIHHNQQPDEKHLDPKFAGLEAERQERGQRLGAGAGRQILAASSMTSASGGQKNLSVCKN